MKYFVTADIHGFYDEFKTALDKSGFDFNNSEHKIVICGDVFDRGSQPKELIDFILTNKEKIIYIRGNHEDLMEYMIDRNYSDYSDVKNGTAETIVKLCPEWQISEFDLKKIAIKTRLQEVLDLSINYYETDKYVFVHGWIPIDEDNNQYDSNWRNAERYRWEISRWTSPVEMYKREIYEPNKIIVCGHHYCSMLWREHCPERFSEFGENANFEPFITDKMIALDACTAYTHKVNIVVLED